MSIPEVPLHVRDQRHAAQKDALIEALQKTGGKMVILFVAYPEHRAAQAAVNVQKCGGQHEVANWAMLGATMEVKLVDMAGELAQQLFNKAPAQDSPAKPTTDTVALVADATEAIMRHCLTYLRINVVGDWSKADLLTYARSMAPLAVSEEWRKQQ